MSLWFSFLGKCKIFNVVDTGRRKYLFSTVIWNLPHTTHCALLPLLCGLLPLMDELACRCAIHSLMVASIVIVMLLILLHVTVSTLGECCLQLVGTLCSAADVLVCDCLPLPI